MDQKKVFTDLFWETAGSALIAIATNSFALPAQFPMTGFNGIAIILYRLWGFPIGFTALVMNIPVVLLCRHLTGTGFLLRSGRCMLLSALMMDYIAPLLPAYQGERLLAALATGVLSGIGYAVIYMRRSSTGGMDLIIISIRTWRPHLKMGSICLAADAGVILLSSFIFRSVDDILYGLTVSFLISAVIDRILCGLNAGKLGLIITEHGTAVCGIIDQTAARGSTLLPGYGGYQNGEKQIVLVACSSREMYEIQAAVKKADQQAFIVILNSSEVHGAGFHVI